MEKFAKLHCEPARFDVPLNGCKMPSVPLDFHNSVNATFRVFLKRLREKLANAPSIIAAILSILTVPQTGCADSSRYGSFNPMLVISDLSLSDFANAAGYLYMYPRNSFPPDEDAVNFVFISSQNAITNERINPDVLTMFDDRAIKQILALDFFNDKCHVLALSSERLGEIVLAVNNESAGLTELNYRCFLLALAFFDGKMLNVDADPISIQGLGDRPVLKILADILSNKEQ